MENVYVKKMIECNDIKKIKQLLLVRCFADLLIGLQTNNLPQKILTQGFGESMLGLLGSVSSICEIWRLHLEFRKK